MQADDIKALSDVRLGHALECLDTAQKVMELGDYKCAANRSYYAVFHAMRAVLVYDRIDAKSTAALSPSSGAYTSRRVYLTRKCLIPCPQMTSLPKNLFLTG